MSKIEVRETRHDLDQIQCSGAFKRAATGQGESREIQAVRQDETYWLDRSAANPTQEKLWVKLDALKQSLNRKLFLGISSFEGHYSNYPAGGFYRRHLDCFRGDDSRIVSIVLYLNENWQSGDGGHLRIYDKSSYTDIAPCGGTMVCFMSRDSEHEVLQNHKARFSFTGWFKANRT